MKSERERRPKAMPRVTEMFMNFKHVFSFALIEFYHHAAQRSHHKNKNIFTALEKPLTYKASHNLFSDYISRESLSISSRFSHHLIMCFFHPSNFPLPLPSSYSYSCSMRLIYINVASTSQLLVLQRSALCV